MKPEVIQNHSPNFREANGRQISCIVLHATATVGVGSPLLWLCNPESKVSAHYLIDKDGTTYQLVEDDNIAWHAGESEYKGAGHVNTISLGIEMVNPNDGHTPYPKEQIFSCAKLCKYLCEAHSIAPEDIVSHADVAPGRKNDPLGFDWEAFREGYEAA